MLLQPKTLLFSCLLIVMFAQVVQSETLPTYRSTLVESGSSGSSETFVFKGTLKDEAGNPVAGMPVRLLTAMLTSDPAETRSDAEGRFELHAPRHYLPLAGLLAQNEDGSQQAFHPLYYAVAFEIENYPMFPEFRLVVKPARLLTGRVIDAEGKPVADAQVSASGNWYRHANGTSDAGGLFTLKVPVDLPFQYLYAFKNNVGFDFLSFVESRHGAERATLANEDSEWMKGNTTPQPPQPRGPIGDEKNVAGPFALTLDGITPFKIRVVNQDGNPIAGQCLSPWLIYKSKADGRDFNSAGANENRLNGISDEQGNVVFPCLPRAQLISFQRWFGTTIADSLHDTYWHSDRDIAYDAERGDTEFVVKLFPTVPVSGTVRFADGRPATKIMLEMFGRGFMACDIPCNPGRTRADFERMGGWTDQDGHYTVPLYSEMLYIFGVASVKIDGRSWGAAPKIDLVSKVGRQSEFENVDFTLKPFTKVKGKLLTCDKKPLAGQHLYFYRFCVRSDRLPESDRPENRDGIEGYILHTFREKVYVPDFVLTSTDGHFEIELPPGEHTVLAQQDEAGDGIRSVHDAMKPLLVFTLDGETEKEIEIVLATDNP